MPLRAPGEEAIDKAHARLGGATIVALAVLLAGAYLLLHPYVGLIHDARIYTLLALNRLHPELFSNDILLRFGSQDDYTLFSPLFAWAISVLGSEPAASLVTLVGAAALLGAAWWFARTFMTASLSWLAVGLLIVMPASYGASGIFTILEGYASPRQLAECLVLLCLAAWLRGRRPLALVLLGLGFLIHPIMALPGAVLLVAMRPEMQRWQPLLAACAAALLATAMAMAGWLPLTRWQFDLEWQAVMGFGSYLKLANWNAYDWAGASNALLTLGVAAFWLPHAGRRIATGMLVTAAGLLLLAWVGGDLLKMVIVTQGQPWRVLWLATAMAILLLPGIVIHGWQGPVLQRCAVLLLITAWVIGSKPLALCFSLPAMLAVAAGGQSVPRRLSGAALHCAMILLIVVSIASLAVAWTDFRTAWGAAGLHDGFQRLGDVANDTVLPALLLLGAWYGVTRIRSVAGVAAIGVILLLPFSLIANAAIGPWTGVLYPRAAREALAPWRELIPPQSEVIWAANLLPKSEPAGAWLLLERPSYFSAVQSVSGLFSRDAAMELHRRSQAVPGSLPIEYPYSIVPGGSAGRGPSCRDIPARFIVTQVQIPDARLVAAPASTPAPFNRLKLYICP